MSVLVRETLHLNLKETIVKKLDANHTRSLRTVSLQIFEVTLYKTAADGYLLPISHTVQVRRTRHAESMWLGPNNSLIVSLQRSKKFRQEYLKLDIQLPDGGTCVLEF